MNELIIVKPEKCTGCNSCIRSCPAPEANTVKQLDSGKFIISVNPDKCIACGECVRICNHGARDYIDDTEEGMSHLIKEKLILIVSPAIKAALPTKWKGVLDWFKSQGCTIYDGSFGADICTWAHIRSIEQGTIGNIVTQPCSAIVKYIETYQPQMLQNLSPIHSPAACSAIYIRDYLRRNNPIAFLSTCIAKKYEFEDTGLINYNITIDKVMDYFERNGISIPVDTSDNYEYKFDDMQGQVGSIYSRPGGLRDNLWLHNPDINITTSKGVQNVYNELNMYVRMPEAKHPQVFDVLSCDFGCNIGPAAQTNQTVFDVMDVMRKVESEAKARRKSGFMGRGDDKLFKRFDEELRQSDFLRNYKPSVPSPVPSAQQLEPVFKKMGKHTPEEREFNCHACGFNSCKDMAIAIARGLNTPDNCIIHAKSVMLAKHSSLSVHSEKLEVVASECLELSEKLKADIVNITSSMDSIDESTSATKERASVVKDLLQNIVTFCSDNPTMDEDSVEQLIGILNTTIDAFSALDDNVNITNENSEAIKGSVSKISSLVDEINKVLGKET
ncbi:MAG: 4Fe-4S dicluster domain-containing protein [Ruminococcus sp.]|nr:4Fe-4S dicluster domain-containing protein [Ruminococcus sp.]